MLESFRNPLDAIRGLPEKQQQKVMRSLLDKMLNSAAGENFTRLVAKQEVALVERVARLEAALDIEHIQETPNVEDRREALSDTLEALVRGDVAGLWFDRAVAPRLDNVDDARELVDLDADEWGATVDRWVRSYRRAGATEMTRSEIVADYVPRQFGVSVRVFVEDVVAWDEADHQHAIRTLLVGNFETVERGIDLAIAEVEG